MEHFPPYPEAILVQKLKEIVARKSINILGLNFRQQVFGAVTSRMYLHYMRDRPIKLQIVKNYYQKSFGRR